MTRIRFLALFVLVVFMLACQTADALLSLASPSPTPTRTRSPTRPANLPPTPTIVIVPPTPTLPPEITGAVTENSRVRAAPSTTAAILTRLNKGDQVKIVGKNAAGDWFQIRLPNDPNGRGWIFAELVQPNGSVDPLPVVQPGAPTPRPYP